jgi:hypothetical protein
VKLAHWSRHNRAGKHVASFLHVDPSAENELQNARPILMVLRVIAAVLFAAAAHAQAPPDLCGAASNPPPVMAPTIFPNLVGPRSDAAFDCLMWQSFIHLNWPARADAPGTPDQSQPFGSANPTVWETFKPYDQVFLSSGNQPGPWTIRRAPAFLTTGLADRVANGEARFLLQTSKFSPAILDHLKHDLGETVQVCGGTLVDQTGQSVYYEMLLNQDEYNYIVRNGLYAADTQLAFAQQHGIVLPTGATSDGPTGSIEVKAAWKIMSPGDLATGRFHTRPAVLVDGAQVTVGLVGLHIYQRVGGFHQGVWATFSQIDNSPLGAQPSSGTYSFFNPSCNGCAVNAKTQPPTPTQVVRIFTATPLVQRVNVYAQQLIRSADQNNPFQYYELVGVQWPISPIPIGNPGQKTPLPDGIPNTGTMMNPVLETFFQTPNTSCLGCHIKASDAQGGSYGASFSFLFGHAK